MTFQPLIVAHRGNSFQAPENTLTAFRQALALGVDAIELDVHLSSDGIPIVIHDAELSRTTNSPPKLHVGQLTASELTRLDAGSWFSPEYAQEPVPTLKQVLQLDFGKTELFIELKLDTNEDCRQLVEAVLAVIEKTKPQFPIILGSFSQEVVAEVRKQAPKQLVFGITEDLSALQEMVDKGYTHLSLWDRLVTPQLMAELQKKGIEIWVFTVNDLARGQFLASLGVRGIITDNPGIYLPLRADPVPVPVPAPAPETYRDLKDTRDTRDI